MYLRETVARMDTARKIGDTLSAFLKSGLESPEHCKQVKAQVLDLVLSQTISAEEQTKFYEKACQEYVGTVIQVRGLPARAIINNGDEANDSSLVSASGDLSKHEFNILLPKIRRVTQDCIKRYYDQSCEYRDYQIRQFEQLLDDFISLTPKGGAKDKEIKSKISEIKREAKCLMKWNELFAILKQSALVSEIDYVFTLKNNPIAAIWTYNELDENCEYPMANNHQELDKTVYVVPDNWAIKDGLVNAGAGFIDEIIRPRREIGCTCSFQWLFSLRDLPDEMLTKKGALYLANRRAKAESMMRPRKWWQL